MTYVTVTSWYVFYVGIRRRIFIIWDVFSAILKRIFCATLAQRLVTTVPLSLLISARWRLNLGEVGPAEKLSGGRSMILLTILQICNKIVERKKINDFVLQICRIAKSLNVRRSIFPPDRPLPLSQIPKPSPPAEKQGEHRGRRGAAIFFSPCFLRRLFHLPRGASHAASPPQNPQPLQHHRPLAAAHVLPPTAPPSARRPSRSRARCGAETTCIPPDHRTPTKCRAQYRTSWRHAAPLQRRCRPHRPALRAVRAEAEAEPPAPRPSPGQRQVLPR